MYFTWYLQVYDFNIGTKIPNNIYFDISYVQNVNNIEFTQIQHVNIIHQMSLKYVVLIQTDITTSYVNDFLIIETYVHNVTIY